MSRKRGRRNTKEDSNSDYETDTYGLADGDDKSRPYYIVEDLPCSLETPRYDMFSYPLSVKDSAVLYSSLLSSRRTWVKGEMFQLYWAKQYMNTKEKDELRKEGIDPESIDQSAARETMNKLCDCMMQGGPHQFPIRLFILKNEEVEKAWNEAKEAKKRDRAIRKQQQEEEKRLKKERRLLRKKLKLEALEKEKELKKDKVKKPRKPYKKSVNNSEKEESTNKKEEAKGKSRRGPNKDARSNAPTKPKKTKSVVRPKPYQEQVMILNLNKMARNDKQLNDLMIKVAGGQASLAEISQFKKYIEKAKAMPPPSGTWKPMLEEVEVTDDEESEEDENVPPVPHTKETLRGKATEGKQKHINEHGGSDVDKPQNVPSKNSQTESTTEMEGSDHGQSNSNGSVTLTDGTLDRSKPPQKSDLKTKANKNDSDSDSDSDKDSGTGSDTDSSSDSDNDNDADTDKPGETAATETETAKKETSTTDSKGNVVEGKTEDGTLAPRPKRRYRKRSKVKTEEEEEEEKAMQLTTFQQKYSNGADMVFEYVENANVRFLLPKYSILEQLEDEESYLLSFIVIHNRREVSLFKTRKLKELNKKKSKEDQVKPEDYNPFMDARCPDPLFSSITLKLYGIPKKFANIILNSFHPKERVQEYMKSILERGNRLSGYNLWYQLDAYDDKDLAESLRNALREYEQNFKSKRQKKQIL